MNKSEMSITVEQLRRLLFHINDEEMTVKELRHKLYDVDNQEHKLEDSFSVFMELGI